MAGKKQPAPPKSVSRGGGAATTTKSSNSTSSSRTAPPRTPKPGRAAAAEDVESEEEELRRQQTLLDVFGSTFRDVLGAADFGAQLQEVKAALFNRDFGGAFAREEALDVYAARWSPTRALCYGRVLRSLDARLQSLGRDLPACVDRARRKYISSEGDIGARKGVDEEDEHARGDQDGSGRKDDARDTGLEDQEASAAAMTAKQTTNECEEEGGGGETRILRVLAIGGAAAEIVAFADYISVHNANPNAAPRTRGDITLLDIGPWGPVVQRLQTALTTPPPISPYARAAAATTSRALVPPKSLRAAFLQRDILSLDRDELAALLSVDDESEPILVTLLFTLNELYTTSGTRRTTAFLRLLSALVAPGSLLLVVDSPGSYAEAAVGKDARRYPMQWLLDHTLVPPASTSASASRPRDGKEDEGSGAEAGVRWERLESHDSVWFRVADGLRYPIPLENMRYQMHLYRAYVG
ncbi:hypothetical protein F5X97DRAFT_310498 [Nemania serpens]|nr:hypothetical protein F5X97DRAFT_310498 [Nemania serpens]